MRTKQLFLTLALLLTAVTGAWADNGRMGRQLGCGL